MTNFAKVKLFSADEIDGEVKKVERAAGRLQDHIHKTAISILKVWETNTAKKGANNVLETAQWAASRLSALQEASPYHRNAFSKWVGEMTNLHWNDERKEWFAMASDENKFMGKAFITARDTPFWKVSPAPAAKPFEMLSELQRILEKRKKHLNRPVDGDALGESAVAIKIQEAIDLLKTEA